MDCFVLCSFRMQHTRTHARTHACTCATTHVEAKYCWQILHFYSIYMRSSLCQFDSYSIAITAIFQLAEQFSLANKKSGDTLMKIRATTGTYMVILMLYSLVH